MPDPRAHSFPCLPRFVPALLLSFAIALLAAGCDKIKIPDLGQGPAAAPPAPTAGGTAPGAQAASNAAPAPVVAPPQMAKPDPKAVVSAFLEKGKTLGAYQDEDLLKVTELTEGLEEVKELKLLGSTITDKGVATLSKFPKLAAVDLSTSLVTNEGIAVISDMPALESLVLRKTAIDDRAMPIIGKKVGLKEIVLAETSVDDVGLAELGDLEDLEVLDISSSGVNGRAFEKFKNHKKLRVVLGQHSHIDNDSLKWLATCPIEELNLDVAGINDQGMLHIGKMKHMKKLSLEFCGVSDISIAKMGPMKDLEYIGLRQNNGVTGRLFNKLVNCKQLKVVNAVGTSISSADIVKLNKILPNVKVMK